MKKLVLSILALSLTVGSFAQNRIRFDQGKTITNADGETQLRNTPSALNTSIPTRKGSQTPRISAVNVTDIGNSPNHLTVGFGSKTAIFAHPSINSIEMIFRNAPTVANAAGTSGYYNYALSTDGGNTWLSNQFPLYEATGGAAPPFANGRYPQSGIYNPIGNTNPNNAYIYFTGAGLAAANGAWGGIPNGALKIQAGSTPYQAEILNDRTQIPNTLTLSPSTNNSYLLDVGVDAAGTADYVDSMALYIGNWNTTNNAYDYSSHPVYAPVGVDGNGGKSIFNGRIAFAPNSNVGFMTVLGHNDYALYVDSVILPMIYKTTDGGMTWTSLGTLDLGPVSAVLPAALDYSTWTEQDLVVDMNGNAHMIVAIGKGFNDNTFATGYGDWGVFDVYSTGGGTGANSWHAQLLDKPQTFNFIWASADNATPEASRGQASTTWSGNKVFFTWFDTDTMTFGVTENAFPDAHMKALDVVTGLWTSSMNMTTGTLADGACSFGNVSPYVLGSTGTYTIPMSFQYLVDPTIGLAVTTHKYVSGLEITDAQFTVAGNSIALPFIPTGINENNNLVNKTVKVYPNPASGRSNTLAFAMDKTAKVSIELLNAIGQVAKTVDYGVLNAGDQKLNLDVEGLQAGIYVVKVKVGDDLAVQKITIK